MRSLIVRAATAAAFCAISAGATAQNGARETPTGCWSRTYHADHLAAHPSQQVVSIRLVLDRQPEFGPDVFGALSATLRDGRSVANGGLCRETEAGAVQCNIDCDGGSFLIEPRASDGSILLRNRGVALVGCGEDAPYFMPPDPEHTLFRLYACDDDVG